MARKTKETNVTSASKNEIKCSCSKLKASTILMGVLAVGAAFIWYGVAHNWVKLPGVPSQNEGEVVATVNGNPIYMSEVQGIANQVPQLAELPFNVIYPKLLEGMINERVLKQAASDADLQNDPVVQKRIADAKSQILSQTYLLNKLNELATDEALKKLYLEEIKGFPHQDEVRARHILVKTRKEAQDVLIQLRAGADFEVLANSKSLDAESNNGGDLGYFRKDMMIPEFSEPVFKMKKGELSNPINTPFGWHVVLVEDRREAAPPAFEDVKEQLRHLSFEKNKNVVINAERDRYEVDILVPSLEEEPTDEELAQEAQAVVDALDAGSEGVAAETSTEEAQEETSTETEAEAAPAPVEAKPTETEAPAKAE